MLKYLTTQMNWLPWLQYPNTWFKRKIRFYPFDLEHMHKAMDKLTEDSKANWGILGPQHMVEHLLWQFEIATGGIRKLKFIHLKSYLINTRRPFINTAPMPKQL